MYSPQSSGSKAFFYSCFIFKPSRFAGAYLFYSILPLFPIYFGLKLAGITDPPATNVVYLVAFVIYALAVPLLWKQKREYDQYIAAVQSLPDAYKSLDGRMADSCQLPAHSFNVKKFYPLQAGL